MNLKKMSYKDIANYYLKKFKTCGLSTEEFCCKYNIRYQSLVRVINSKYKNNFPSEYVIYFTKAAIELKLDDPYLFHKKIAADIGGIFIPPEEFEKHGIKGEDIELLRSIINSLTATFIKDKTIPA